MEVMRGEGGGEPPGALAAAATVAARGKRFCARAAAEQKSLKRAGRSRSVAALSEGEVFRGRCLALFQISYFEGEILISAMSPFLKSSFVREKANPLFSQT